jgi:hypothetical protein
MDKLESKIEVESTKLPDDDDDVDGADAEHDGDNGHGMDRIRELLFGSKMREHDAHFRDIEDKIRVELSALSTELRTRIDALENYIKTELKSLGDQLRVESKERRDAVKEVQSQNHAEHEAATKTSQEFNDSMQRTFRETREFVSNESRLLSDRLGQSSKKLLEELARVETAIEHSKVDKTSLAAFFGELALQLNDSGSPDAKAAHERPHRN